MFNIFVLLSDLIWIYSWIVVIYALMSWLPQVANSAVGRFIVSIVRPYLRLFDRIPTRFGMFDFQPLLAYVVLLILQRLVLML